MAEKSKIGRKKSGSERDLGAFNCKPALQPKSQPVRLGVGGAPLASASMLLSAAPERIMHSLRVLDILERIDAELRRNVAPVATNKPTSRSQIDLPRDRAS